MSDEMFSLIDDGRFNEFREKFLNSEKDLSKSLDRRGNSLLAQAVINEDLRFVDFICEFAHNLHACDRSVGGEPALMFAFDVGNEKIIDSILSRCDLNDTHEVLTWLGVPLSERIAEFISERRKGGVG